MGVYKTRIYSAVYLSFFEFKLPRNNLYDISVFKKLL